MITVTMFTSSFCSLKRYYVILHFIKHIPKNMILYIYIYMFLIPNINTGKLDNEHI